MRAGLGHLSALLVCEVKAQQCLVPQKAREF